jgi:ABC-type glycerol-3-phosphate transport system substrate-binding protein
MKTTHLLATLVAASFPLTAIVAEDSGRTETTDQKHEQSCDMMGMRGTDKGGMMSSWEDQDRALDKLVEEMNSATPDKKVEAVAAVLNQLIEQRKATRQQMQNLMAANRNGMMEMCRMMMNMMTGMKMEGDQGRQSDTTHEHHH